MKLTEKTINILNVLKKIQQNIILESDSIKIKNTSGTLLAIYEPEEEFERAVPIYDLRDFCSILSLIGNDVNLDLSNDNYFKLSNDSNTMIQKFAYTNPDMLLLPDSKKLESLKEFDTVFEFKVKAQDLKSVIAGSTINDTEWVSISASDGNLYLESLNLSNNHTANKNSFKVKIGSSNVDMTVYVGLEDLSKIMIGDSTVEIVQAGNNYIVKITLDDIPLTYYILTNDDSVISDE